MVHLVLAAAFNVLAVTKATVAPVIDGKLDDACWRDAKWESDFRRLAAYAKVEGAVPETKFAFAADEHNLYFAARCVEEDIEKVRAHKVVPVWFGNNVEIFLSPSGRTDDFYHFALSPNTDRVLASYYAESGGIQPDPYSPAWQHACVFDGNGWTAELAIPFSAFYMTRNADWSGTWIANVARTFQRPYTLASWAPLEIGFHEPQNFRKVGGIPMRPASDDLAVRTATAEMEGSAADGIRGMLRLDAFAALAGEYEVETSSGAKEKVVLKSGDNIVSVPCVYKGNGRFPTHIVLRNLATGTVFERDYPVVVDYRPIRVKFTVPQYRDNFYPGQCTDEVKGRLTVAGGAKAKLTFEGPGFATRTAEIDGEGDFAFDTKGFEKGEAWLTVETGELKERFRVRNLPETGHRMIWIENGNLMVNGKPRIRRNIYAERFSVGREMNRKLDRDLESFALTRDFGAVTIEIVRLDPGKFKAEAKEATRDAMPCAEFMRKVEEVYEKNKDRDFGCYYIADEPECRGLSPIWLRHVYERIAELDPYHPVFLSSRAGRMYTECADWFETHPYLNCGWTADGRRRYGNHPKDVGRFIEAFGLADRPDKCVGFLPTCFAYRWSSFVNDYPTFDEYVLHLWCGLMHGAQSLYPYAGHDIGDRPSTYNGVRYGFQSVAALEDFLTVAKRTKLTTPADTEAMLFELPDGEKLLVVANYTDRPQTVRLDGVSGSFREFRGNRIFNHEISLRPLETFVSTTKPRDEGLEPLAAVRARVDREEAARKGRDNQLRGRYETTEFKSNLKSSHSGKYYKLIDGTLDVLARMARGAEPTWMEIECKDYAPTFDRLLVWGDGVKEVRASVFADGAWTPLDAKVTHDGLKTELVFDGRRTANRFRLDFPADKKHPVDFELYEIEIPYAR